MGYPVSVEKLVQGKTAHPQAISSNPKWDGLNFKVEIVGKLLRIAKQLYYTLSTTKVIERGIEFRLIYR